MKSYDWVGVLYCVTLALALVVGMMRRKETPNEEKGGDQNGEVPRLYDPRDAGDQRNVRRLRDRDSDVLSPGP